MDKEMLDHILETYRCILSCRKKMPGMKLEDALNSEAVNDMELEYTWLLSLSQKKGMDHAKEGPQN